MILLAIQLPSTKTLLAFSVLLVLLAWETLHSFFHFPKGQKRLVHGGRNVVLGIFNGLMTTLGFVGLWWFDAELAAKNGVGLFHWLAVPNPADWVLAVLLPSLRFIRLF